MKTPSALTSSGPDHRGVLRQIIHDEIKTTYDTLDPAARDDFHRMDTAARIITAMEKAGWILHAPERPYLKAKP